MIGGGVNNKMIYDEIGDDLSKQTATQGYNFIVFRHLDRMNFIASTMGEYEKQAVISFDCSIQVLKGLLLKNLFLNPDIYDGINNIEKQKRKVYGETNLGLITNRKKYFELCISQQMLLMILHQNYNLIETAHGVQPKTAAKT